MKKKGIIVIITCVMIACTLIIAGGVTYAIWTKNAHDSIYMEIPIVDENPSVKYQMFVPVKSSGDTVSATTSAYTKISGSFSVNEERYSYTLTNPSEKSSIVGYALVGWFGGISLSDMEVPSEYSMNIDGEVVTKPVVRVMVDKAFENYAFAGNRVLSKVTIGANVLEIDSGAFYGMKDLSELVLKTTESSAPIYIKEYAFAFCTKLNTKLILRAIDENCNETTIYLGSGSAV